MRRAILVSLLLCGLLPLTVAAQDGSSDDMLGFGERVVLLTPVGVPVESAEFYEMYNFDLTADGRYAAAFVRLYDPSYNSFDARLLVWDLEAALNADVTETGQPEALIEAPLAYSEVFNPGDDLRLAFDPFSSYMAVRASDELIVYSLPGFSVYHAGEPGGSLDDGFVADPLVWSPDGGTLGLLSRDRLVLWSLMDQTYRERVFDGLSEGQITHLDAGRHGWLLSNSGTSQHDAAFIFCPQSLACEIYDTSDATWFSGQAAADASWVLVRQQPTNGTGSLLTLWRWEESVGAYEQDTQAAAIIDDRYPDSSSATPDFSPEGRYLIGVYRDVAGWMTVLHDTVSYAQRRALPGLRYPTFLNRTNESLFVSTHRDPTDAADFLTLYLETPADEAPLATLPLQSLPGDLRQYAVLDLTGVRAQTSDGERLLIALGEAALVVDIVGR